MWYLVHGVHSEGVGPETVVNWDKRQAGTEGFKSEEEHKRESH